MEISINIYQTESYGMRELFRMLFSRLVEPLRKSKAEAKRSLMEQIIKDYDGMISRLCFGYSRDRDEFEDIRQDAFTNIWQGLDKFRGDASLKTWIYRVTLNTCVSVVRERSKARYTVDLAAVADVADDAGEKAAQVAALYQSIEMLSPVDKAVVMLWLDELSYDEIAETVGLSRSAVAVRLHRAKQKLKDTLI